MRFPWACLCLNAVLLAGCDDLQPQPTISAVEPDQAYSDQDVSITLVGDGFVPATLLDPGSGRRIAITDGFQVRVGNGAGWAELTGLAWQSPSRIAGLLSGTLAQDLATGWLDVELTDPRGGKAVHANIFHELGHDDSAPNVTFLSPATNTPIAPGMLLRGTFHAADVPPGTLSALGWTYSENQPVVASPCLAPLNGSEADCSFEVTVSAKLNLATQVFFTATAIDTAGNSGEATLTFALHATPAIQSISPATGGTAGGTDVVIKGSGFLAGSWAAVDDVPLFPAGGIVVDESTLSGYVPAHDAGQGTLVVHTPIGDATWPAGFNYLSPPRIDTIMPSIGAASGGTPVTITGRHFSDQTQISFGSTLDSAVPLTNPVWKGDTSIVGLAPLGTGQTTVWAFDAELGATPLKNGFSWSPQ